MRNAKSRFNDKRKGDVTFVQKFVAINGYSPYGMSKFATGLQRVCCDNGCTACQDCTFAYQT